MIVTQYDRLDGFHALDFDTSVTLLLQASIRVLVSPLWRPKVCHIAMRRPDLGQHEDVPTLAAVGHHVVAGVPLEILKDCQQEDHSGGACGGCHRAVIQHGVPECGQLNRFDAGHGTSGRGSFDPSTNSGLRSPSRVSCLAVSRRICGLNKCAHLLKQKK